MTTTLEHELSTGLREQADGVHLSRDVLAAARARHRRRTAVTRAASATGTVGLAGAVAAAVALSGPAAPAPGPKAPAASAPDGTRLDATTVSARITQALLASETSVHHLDTRITQGGRTSRTQLWEDPTSGAFRYEGRKVPSAPPMKMAVAVHGTRQTTTVVDPQRRVWWTEELEISGVPAPPRDGGPLGDATPEGLRKALAAGTWRLVGKERLDGRATVHLRVTEQAGYDGEYDLWVDAESFRFVRRAVVTSTDDGALSYVEDWQYLPRTERVLSQLELEVPKGYRKVPAPQSRG